MDVSDSTLRGMHIGAAVCHLAQFAYAEALVNTVFKDQGEFPIGNPVLNHPDSTIGTYNVAQIVPIFSLLSAVNHTWSFSDFSGYLTWLDRGYNPVRWMEYSASASLMYWVMGTLSGIVDVKTLVFLALSNVVLQVGGYSIEKDSASAIRHDDARFYDAAIRQQGMMFLLFAAQMVCIWTAFFTSVAESTEAVPISVWFIIFIITAFFISFGLLSMAYTRGFNKSSRVLSESHFRRVEVGYIILSFLAKTFLMNMVLFGSVSVPITQTSPTPTPQK